MEAARLHGDALTPRMQRRLALQDTPQPGGRLDGVDPTRPLLERRKGGAPAAGAGIQYVLASEARTQVREEAGRWLLTCRQLLVELGSLPVGQLPEEGVEQPLPRMLGLVCARGARQLCLERCEQVGRQIAPEALDQLMQRTRGAAPNVAGREAEGAVLQDIAQLRVVEDQQVLDLKRIGEERRARHLALLPPTPPSSLPHHPDPPSPAIRLKPP